METVVEYPLWKLAAAKIQEAFEVKGYDILFHHEQLKEWMGIKEPTTFAEADKTRLDYLNGMEKLRNYLLKESNLYLHPFLGSGYKLLEPKDQIRAGADYYIQRSLKALKKSAYVLANVDSDKLDTESKNLRLMKMGRMAFVKHAFRKRTIAIKPSEIEDKS